MLKDTDYVPAIQWLWDNRNKPFIFGPSVITEANRPLDAATISPTFTPIEAENLFQFLARKELLFKQENGYYIINKVESHKWKSLISDLKRWDWTRHWFWTAWHKVFATLFLALVGGWIGSVAAKWTESKLSTPKQEIIGDAPKPTAQQAAADNQAQGNQNGNTVITEPIPKAP